MQCLQNTRDPESKQQLQTKLARIEQQIKEEQNRRQQQTALKSHKVLSLHAQLPDLHLILLLSTISCIALQERHIC